MFKNAKEGDEVYAELWGDGVIKDVITYRTYPVCVEFISGRTARFTPSGYEHTGHTKPSLFYRKGKRRNLTERPEPDPDWPNVEPGTKFFIGGGARAFRFFAEGKPWFDRELPMGDYVWSPHEDLEITPVPMQPPAPDNPKDEDGNPIKMWVR